MKNVNILLTSDVNINDLEILFRKIMRVHRLYQPYEVRPSDFELFAPFLSDYPFARWPFKFA